MVDQDLIFAKIGAARSHILRIEKKRGDDSAAFLADQDRQDIVAFNFQAAIQNCIDIAAHIISERGLGVPGSVSEMFLLLEENGLIGNRVAEDMVRAVGFRNLLVHEYGKMDIERVFVIARDNLKDIEAFLSEILKNLNLSA